MKVYTMTETNFIWLYLEAYNFIEIYSDHLCILFCYLTSIQNLSFFSLVHTDIPTYSHYASLHPIDLGIDLQLYPWMERCLTTFTTSILAKSCFRIVGAILSLQFQGGKNIGMSPWTRLPLSPYKLGWIPGQVGLVVPLGHWPSKRNKKIVAYSCIMSQPKAFDGIIITREESRMSSRKESVEG